MKKYDKRNVMRNAWASRKSANVSMSVAMKAAWKLEKAMAQAEEDGKESGCNYKVVANDWVKYGKNRTYISLRLYTNAWNIKREHKYGYIDNMTGEMIAA